MQLSFDATTPVLDLGATWEPVKARRLLWILWPALAYRILMTIQPVSRFNLFQRTILRCCQAGVRTSAELARLLDLAEAHVALVQAELLSMGLLHLDGSPTRKGLALQAEDLDGVQAEEAGFVFVDAHNGRLWPRVQRGSLPLVEAAPQQGNLWLVKVGSQGNPEERKAWMIRPRGRVEPGLAPAPQDLLKALRLHGRRARSYAREMAEADRAEPTRDGATPRSLRRVSSEPEPVLVLACVFLPRDARKSMWQVTDPCGLGVTGLLREELLRLGQAEHPGVRKLITDLTQEAWQVDGGDMAVYLEETRVAASRVVSGYLGKGAELLPISVVAKLEDAENRLAEAKRPSAASHQALNQFLGHAFAALEGLFGFLPGQYPDPVILLLLGEDALENGERLARVAATLGFSTGARTHVLLRTTSAKVEAVLSGNRRSLNDGLAAALLAAQLNSEHPFHGLAARNPEALAFMAQFQDLRQKSLHSSDAVFSLTDVLLVHQELYQFLRDLLGVATPEPGGSAPEGPAWAPDLLFRMRTQAVRAMAVHPELEDRPVLRTRLVEMRQAGQFLEQRSGEGEARTARTVDYVGAMANALETLLAEVQHCAPSQPQAVAEVTEDRAANAQLFTAVANGLGFQLEDGGVLPRGLTHAQPRLIRKAAEGRPQTISAMIFAQLMNATGLEGHPYRSLAQTAPGFLLRAARIVEARGHADEARVDADAALSMEGPFVNDVIALLRVLD